MFIISVLSAFTNIIISGFAKINTIALIKIQNSTTLLSAFLIPSFILPYLPAPKFCAIKVENAFPKSCTGIYAMVSIFTETANAAIICVPKLFTIPCTISMPKFITDCCRHVIPDSIAMSYAVRFTNFVSSYFNRSSG